MHREHIKNVSAVQKLILPKENHTSFPRFIFRFYPVMKHVKVQSLNKRGFRKFCKGGGGGGIKLTSVLI